MKRLSLLFTVLVFTALAAGVLSRHRFHSAPAPTSFPPVPAPRFAPITDPEEGRASLLVRVVDERREPIADAAVCLRSGDSPHWGFTGADGRATLERIAPEPSELVVLAWPHPPLAVQVTPGPEEREVQMLAPLPPLEGVPDITRAPLKGVVAPSLGEDPAAYEVVLLPVDAPQVLGGAVPRRATTDARGSFAIEDLATGRYRVLVIPTWARGGTWPDLAPSDAAQLEHRVDEPLLRLVLASGALEGEVLDEEGRELEGALVLATSAQDETRVWPPTVTNEAGRFRVGDLPPGEYRVSVRAGEGQASAAVVKVSAGSVATAEVPPLQPRKPPAK